MSTITKIICIMFITCLSSLTGAQCAPLIPGPGSGCVGPVLITTASPTVQSSIILVDISKPVPTPAATQYILSIVNGTLQESDNGSAYHTLVGPKGDPGAVGASGQPGVAGTNGRDGANGVNGKDGINGINGTNGKDGTNGLNGSQGPQGIPGIDSFQVGSSMTVIVTGCNIVGVGRSCVLKRVK